MLLEYTVDSDSEPEDALHIGSNNDDTDSNQPPRKKAKTNSSGTYNDFSARMMVGRSPVLVKLTIKLCDIGDWELFSRRKYNYPHISTYIHIYHIE